MRRPGWKRLAQLVAGAGFGLLAALWAVEQLREWEVTRRDLQEVARMTKETKTVCLGRFLINMPGEIHQEIAQPRINGFDIASFEEPEADFQGRLEISSSIRSHHPRPPGT